MQQKYEKENKDGNSFESSLRAAIIVAMDSKCQKLNAPFTKHFAIANPHNGLTFLMEVSFWSPLKFVTLLYLAPNAPLW